MLVEAKADLNKPDNVRPTSASHNTVVWGCEAGRGRAGSVRLRVVRVRFVRVRVVSVRAWVV